MPVPDPQQFTEVFARVSFWAIALAFLLGLLSTLTPGTLALLPVVAGYVGATARSRLAAWARALAFVGGVSLVNMAVGALFGAAGSFAQQLTGGNLALWNALAGLLTLWVALAALGVMPLPLPVIPVSSARGSAWYGAFVLGLPFGLVTCPTCVPLMVAVALGAALTGAACTARHSPLPSPLAAVSHRRPSVPRPVCSLCRTLLALLIAAPYLLGEAGGWAVCGMPMPPR